MDEESVKSCTTCPEIVAGKNGDHPVSLAPAKRRQSRSHLGKMDSSMICKGNGVDEFLEYPVCSSSLFRPVHQVLLPLFDPLMVYSNLGGIPYLIARLRDHHGVDMHSGQMFNHRYVKSNPRKVDNATWMLTVFHCFDRYFCLHFEAFQLGMAPVYMAFLRFMGEKIDAQKYGYSLEIGSNGRKLIWEGMPRSIRDSHRKVRAAMKGSLYSEIWHCSSLVAIGRSLSCMSPDGYGRKAEPKTLIDLA
ncbi:hypothetical protein Droror1_Dr00027440 [Drosera rotundifolia]